MSRSALLERPGDRGSAGGLRDPAPHLLISPEPADLEGDDRGAALRRRDRAAGKLAAGATGLALGFRRAAAIGGGAAGRGEGRTDRPHRFQGWAVVQDRCFALKASDSADEDDHGAALRRRDRAAGKLAAGATGL